MKLALVELPAGWKPAACHLCSKDFACHQDYKANGACPLANAKPLKADPSWEEIANAASEETFVVDKRGRE